MGGERGREGGGRECEEQNPFQNVYKMRPAQGPRKHSLSHVTPDEYIRYFVSRWPVRRSVRAPLVNAVG